MFDQTFVNVQAQTRRPWTLAVSVVFQAALVATMLIMPLLHVAKLDLPAKIQFKLPVEIIDLRTKPQPVQQTASAQTHTVTAPRPFVERWITVPTSVPAHIEMSPDAPVFANTGSVGPSIGTGVLSVLGALPTAPPPSVVHEPMTTKAPTPAQIHVSSGVQAGMLIVAPRPVYPRIAVAARMQGTVHIQAIIERDGTIGHLKVLSGPPLLQNAALDAVKQWRYKPTLLNGEPVEVVTEIDVNFALNSQ
jgi:protein TonB